MGMELSTQKACSTTTISLMNFSATVIIFIIKFSFPFSFSDPLTFSGIEPHVTLSHFDVPQALEDEYRGFKGPKFMYNSRMTYIHCLLEGVIELSITYR